MLTKSSASLATIVTGTTVYVTGYGFNIGTGREEALLWTQPIPAPGAAVVLGLGAFMASRRRRAIVAPQSHSET